MAALVLCGSTEACAVDTPNNIPESVAPPGIQAVAYDSSVDYMELMIKCAEKDTEYSMMVGALYEEQRNMKIDQLGLDCEKTNYFTTFDGVAVRNLLVNGEGEIKKCYTDGDAIMLARVMYGEGRGIRSKTELSCIAWTVLNRVDAGMGSIAGVITAPNQFAYSRMSPTISDYDYDLVELAIDVLDRWSAEKAGEVSVGRTLPGNYLWYSGDGQHNYFRTQYRGGNVWNYSLASPYDT